MLHLSKFSAAFLVLTLLAGCYGNSSGREETGGVIRINAQLDRMGAVLITTPHDAGINNQTYTGSGETVARTLDASFSRYAAIVDTTPLEYMSLEQLQALTAGHDYAYIVVPRITRWSAPTTQWSRYPAQIGVKVTILDAVTGQEISSNFLKSRAPDRGSLSDTFNIDSHEPADMLSGLVDDYVEDLYGVTLLLQ